MKVVVDQQLCEGNMRCQEAAPEVFEVGDDDKSRVLIGNPPESMREKIKLESTAGTGHFYTTTKNKRTTPDKMEIKKYDPRARKHVIYKETKIK